MFIINDVCSSDQIVKKTKSMEQKCNFLKFSTEININTQKKRMPQIKTLYIHEDSGAFHNLKKEERRWMREREREMGV